MATSNLTYDQQVAILSMMTEQEKAHYVQTGQMPQQSVQRYQNYLLDTKNKAMMQVSQEDAILRRNGIDPKSISPDTRAEMLKLYGDQMTPQELRENAGQVSGAQSGGSTPAGGGGGGGGGYSYTPTVSPLAGALNTQAAMMAGNTAAQHGNIITPITGSAYSTMGAGIPSGPGGTTNAAAAGQDPARIAVAMQAINDPAMRQKLAQANWFGDPANLHAYYAAQRQVQASRQTGNQFLSIYGPQSMGGPKRLGPAPVEGEQTKQATPNEIYESGLKHAQDLLKRGKITQAEYDAYVAGGAEQFAHTQQQDTAASANGPAVQAALNAAPLTDFSDTGTTGGAPATTPTANTTEASGTTGEQLVGNLSSQLGDAYAQTRADNLARYEDILKGRLDHRTRTLEELAGLGKSEEKRINLSYDQMKKANEQSLIGRGLGSTTVTDNVLSGLEFDRNQSLGDLYDRLKREKIGQDTSTSEGIFQFMERRDDPYVDPAFLASLSQGVGAAGPNVTAPTSMTQPPAQQQPQQPQTPQSSYTPVFNTQPQQQQPQASAAPTAAPTQPQAPLPQPPLPQPNPMTPQQQQLMSASGYAWMKKQPKPKPQPMW